MPERSTVLQRSQIGMETTPGTAVAATKILGATSFSLTPAGSVNMFGPQGQKMDTIAAPGKEWTGIAVDGFGSYPDLSYLLNMLMRSASGVQQGGSAAYLWTFASQSAAEDAIKTATIEQGSLTRAGRAPYAFISDLELTWDREKVAVKGAGMAQRYEDDFPLSTSATYTLTAGGSPPTAGTFTLTYLGQTTAGINWNATPAAVKAALELLSTLGADSVDVVATVATGAGTLAVAANVYTITFKRAFAAAPQTLTGTFTGLTASGTIALAAGVTGLAPTLINPVPILPNQIDVYMDPSYATLGTTKLTRAFSGSWKYGQRFNTVWPVNSSDASFAAHIEQKPVAQFSFMHAADNVGMALLATCRAGDTKYIRWKAVGALIASTYYYTAQLDVAVKISEVLKFEDRDGIYQVGVVGNIVQDAGSSTSQAWAITNAVSAL